jgi:hypothetical protein
LIAGDTSVKPESPGAPSGNFPHAPRFTEQHKRRQKAKPEKTTASARDNTIESSERPKTCSIDLRRAAFIPAWLRRRAAPDVAKIGEPAIMFRRIVPKMHQTLTHLATIRRDHWNHEDAGCYFNSCAADNYRSGLHRPAFDQRAGDRAADELSGPFEWLFSGTRAMLSVDQFLRLISVPAVFAAFLIASQISAAVTPQSNPMTMARD